MLDVRVTDMDDRSVAGSISSDESVCAQRAKRKKGYLTRSCHHSNSHCNMILGDIH